MCKGIGETGPGFCGHCVGCANFLGMGQAEGFWILRAGGVQPRVGCVTGWAGFRSGLKQRCIGTAVARCAKFCVQPASPCPKRYPSAKSDKDETGSKAMHANGLGYGACRCFHF